MKIFEYLLPAKPNFIQKLLGKSPENNAFIELNNLLASNQLDIRVISIKDVEKISEKYKSDIRTKFKKPKLMLFRTFISHCLEDEKLEDTDILKIDHLKNLLMLNENDVNEIITSETERVYENKVKVAIEKGKINFNENKRLKDLQSDLLITENRAIEIININAKQFLKNYIDEILSNERVSPEDEYRLNEIANSFGIDLSLDRNTEEKIQRYKQYWKLENEELPEISSDINIQKSEKLHFESDVKWLEQRRITKRLNYGGPTARIKIAKGLYYRVGSLSVQRATEDVWQTIDVGRLFLTNKRIIFMGLKGNKTIRLNTILDFKPYSDGVDIQKESGKSPFLEFNTDVDIFSLMLSRLLQMS